MACKETSKKQKKSASQLSRTKLTKVNPAAHFRRLSKKKLHEALNACLLEDDIDSLKEILIAFIESNNKAEIAERLEISRTTIYQIYSDDWNPKIKTLAKLLQAVA